MAALRDLLEDEIQSSGNQHSLHDDIQDAVATVRNWLLVRDGGNRRVKLEFFDDTMNKFFKSITETHTTIDSLNRIESYADSQIEDAAEKILHKKVARQFIEAYKVIRGIIEDNITSAKDLCDAVEKVRELQVIKFKCKRYELVHSLFEGLNSKGIKLTRSEQIKNIVFDQVEKLTLMDDDSTMSKNLKGKWSDLEYIFDTHDSNKNLFDKFLRHYWVANFKLVYMPQLYDVYKKKVGQFEAPDELANFLDELNSAAKFYIAIKDTTLNNNEFAYITDQGLIDRLNLFGLLDNDQILEVLLLYRHIILNRLVSKQQLKKWLDYFWFITFRLKYVSVSPSDFEKELVKYLIGARKILASDPSTIEEEVKVYTRSTIVNKLWPLVANVDLFVKNLADKLYYTQNNKPIIRKLISDLLLQTNRNIVIKDPSIEHILPQKPVKWGFDGKDVKDIVNKLGNLTLLNNNDNNDAGNEPFSIKVSAVYSVSHFDLNKDIINYEGFSSRDLLEIEKAIFDRGTDIASAIERVYQINGSSLR